MNEEFDLYWQGFHDNCRTIRLQSILHFHVYDVLKLVYNTDEVHDHWEKIVSMPNKPFEHWHTMVFKNYKWEHNQKVYTYEQSPVLPVHTVIRLLAMLPEGKDIASEYLNNCLEQLRRCIEDLRDDVYHKLYEKKSISVDANALEDALRYL